MSYSKSMLQFFVPRGSASLDVEAIDVAAAVHGGLLCVKRCKVKRIGFLLETLVDSDTQNAKLQFNRRAVPLVATYDGVAHDATNGGLVGELTIPDETAAGAVIYKDVTPILFEVGDELALEHTLIATSSGTVAGDGYYFVEADDAPEEAAEESNMTASA